MFELAPMDLVILEIAMQRLMKDIDLGLEAGRQCAFILGKIEGRLGQMTSQVPPGPTPPGPGPEAFVEEK